MSLQIYFFSEIAELFCLLNDLRGVDDISIKQMGLNMKSKFNKYWGDLTKMNFLIFISNVLIPQYKCNYLKFSINIIYGDMIGGSLLDNIKSAMFELYNDYVLEGPSVNETAATTNAF